MKNSGIKIAVALFFIAIMSLVLLTQHVEEKTTKTYFVASTLDKYATKTLQFVNQTQNPEQLQCFLQIMPDSNLGVRLLDAAGNVLFDRFPATPPQTDALSNNAVFLSADQKIHYASRYQSSNYTLWLSLPFDASTSPNWAMLLTIGILLLAPTTLLYWLIKRHLNNVTNEKTTIKRQLTQNIAHELKTPVSSIIGYSETILSSPKMSEQQKHTFLERLYSQAQRLKLLLDDLSVINKLDDARDLYEKTPCNLSRIVDEVLQDLRHPIEEHNATIQLSLPSEMPIFGSQSLLYSIFRNLIENALLYSGDTPTVTIALIEDAKRYYRLLLSDNGKGVAESHLPHLFERFYRIDQGRSRKQGGSGLGLSIVKNAVLFHHGTIEASNGNTCGLQFDITLRKY